MSVAIPRPHSLRLATHAPPRIDAIRILGYSSAIAINLIAAGLLLMPLRAPPPVAPAEQPPPWIIPATPLPPVLPPVDVQVRPPTETPRVVPTLPATVPTVPSPVVVEQGVLPALSPVDVVPAETIEAPPTVAGPAPRRLDYAHAPAPPYPRQALRDGDEGIVVLQVLVDVDGRPLQVEIAEGSGHRELDQAARRHVLAHWRFVPALHEGRAVQAIGLVPIEFSLD